MNPIKINLNKKFEDVNYFSNYIRYLSCSSLEKLFDSVVISVSFISVILPLTNTIIHGDYSLIINLVVLLYYGTPIINDMRLLIVILSKYFFIRNISRKNFKNNYTIENWKIKYLSAKRINLINIIIAKNNNLLNDEEFIKVKELFVSNLHNMFFNGRIFILLIELKNNFNFTSEQFFEIKKYFIKTYRVRATNEELLSLQRNGILTEKEVIKKMRQLAIQNISNS